MTSAGSNGTAAPSPPLLPQNCVDLDIRQTEALGDLAGEHRFTAAVADYCDACMIPAFATTPSGTSPAAASHTSVRCGTISAQSVAQRATFQNKTELRRQSAGGGVFRLDRGLDAVRVQLRKTMMQYDACRLGHQTLAPERRSQYPTQLQSPVPRLTLMIIDHSREATGAQQDPPGRSQRSSTTRDWRMRATVSPDRARPESPRSASPPRCLRPREAVRRPLSAAGGASIARFQERAGPWRGRAFGCRASVRAKRCRRVSIACVIVAPASQARRPLKLGADLIAHFDESGHILPRPINPWSHSVYEKFDPLYDGGAARWRRSHPVRAIVCCAVRSVGSASTPPRARSSVVTATASISRVKAMSTCCPATGGARRKAAIVSIS